MDVQLRRSWRFLTTYLKLFFCPITSRSRRDEEFPMHPFQALNRNFRLLAHYLLPQWLRMGLLAVILCGTIFVQLVTPLVASRLIDQATAGADLRDLIVLTL